MDFSGFWKCICVAFICVFLAALTGCQSSGSSSSETPGQGNIKVKLHPVLTGGTKYKSKVIEKAFGRSARGESIAFGNQKIPISARSLQFSGKPRIAGIFELVQIGRVPAPAIQSYMEDILARLLKDWPGPLPKIGIFLIPRPTFGASATPSGDILINMGALQAVESESQLAALIAHEASHILLNHHQRTEIAKRNRKAISQITTVALMGLQVANMDSRRYGNRTEIYVANPSQLAQQQRGAMGYWLAAQTVADDVINSLWSREQEDEADAMAADLLARAGYYHEAIVEVLDHQARGEAETKRLKNVLSPVLQLSGGASLLGSILEGDRAGALQGLTQMGAAILVDIGANLGREILRQHQSAEKRKKSVYKYLEEHYADLVPSVQDNTEFERKIGQNRQAQNLIRSYGLLFSASENGAVAANRDSAAEVNEALKTARAGLEGTGYGHPYAVVTNYKVLKAAGRSSDAYAMIGKTRNLDYAPLDYFQIMIGERLDRGDVKGARQTLDSGQQLLGDRQVFLPQRIRVALAEENAVLANAALQECKATKDDNLIQVCSNAASGGAGRITEETMANEKTGAFSWLTKSSVEVSEAPRQPANHTSGQPRQSDNPVANVARKVFGGMVGSLLGN